MGPKKYVICDIEATGLNEDRDLIEIALITFQNDKITEIYETLINPLRPISEYISHLTSISNRDLIAAPKFYDVADAIRMRLDGAVFVSHNTEFDLGLLRKKYQELGQELRVKNFCTLKVAQHEIPGLQSYNLDALCSFFGIKIEDRHRAIGDAKATLSLFKELMQLRLKVHPKIMFLPHHEKEFKKLSSKAGLLKFKNLNGQVLYLEAVQNLEKRARELLTVKAENKKFLMETATIEGETTGSALVAEFKRLLLQPYHPHWIIYLQEQKNGEKKFKIRPYKKGFPALWFFKNYSDAKIKLRGLENQLVSDKFIYREGEKSKEEIVFHNKKVEHLIREARFPTDHIVILGEGRVLNEKTLIVIRHNHVLGYGHTMASEEEIFEAPDKYITQRFFQHLGVDLAARRYIRILKNLRQKTESWRTLSVSH